MNKGVILCSLSLALLSLPIMAWAGANPDFDMDAKPILRMQPGLLSYVRSHFEVKETGKAKYPGDDDRRPQPPFIFRARAIGSDGPYNIHLLIQPGPAGRILCIVPPAGSAPYGPPQGQPQPGGQPPEVAQEPSQEPQPQPFQPQQEPAQAPYQPQEAQPAYQSPSLSQGDIKPLPSDNGSQPAQQPAPAPQQPAPSAPTSDTPSGPTADTPSGPIMPNSSTGTANPQQSLAPPPDPAPSGQ
jgi:hypothetical protein